MIVVITAVSLKFICSLYKIQQIRNVHLSLSVQHVPGSIDMSSFLTDDSLFALNGVSDRVECLFHSKNMASGFDPLSQQFQNLQCRVHGFV